MTIAFWCVFFAFLLPYVWIVAAKVKAPGMNNQTPRLALAQLEGWKQRAHWAHLNALEAFPPFAAAVIIAHFMQLSQSNVDLLAIVFIVARFFHGVFYISDNATLRSLVWFIGFVCIIGLFVG